MKTRSDYLDRTIVGAIGYHTLYLLIKKNGATFSRAKVAKVNVIALVLRRI